MPPISEKRSPPIVKENAKENISTPNSLCEKTNRVPEILDFRESWLKEIDIHKDPIRAQQLLSQHNHVHTPDGCQRDNNSKESVKTLEAVKRRIRTRSGSDPFDPSKSKTSSRDPDDDLVLKRAREETYNNNHNHQNHNQQSPVLNGNQVLQTSKNTVNSNHASCLLNSQMEKATINSPVSPQIQEPPTPSSPAHTNDLNTKIANKSKLPTPTATSVPTTSLTNGKPSSPITNGITNGVPNCSNPKTIVSIKSEENTQSESVKTDQSGYKSGSECSELEDDEDFADIENDDTYDSSSDSEDEYKGSPYYLDSDEEFEASNFKSKSNIAENQYITPSSPFTPSLFPFVPPYLTFSSHAEKGPEMPTEVQKVLKWKLTAVMPKIVRRVVANSGFRLNKKTNDWMGTWEKHMKSPVFRTIRSHQKYNHLPGTFKIGRKDSVWRNLRTLIGKHGRKEFGFMQKTYIIPQELATLRKDWPKYSKKNIKWIVKPPASARGTGIKVINRWSQIPKQTPVIVQKYIEKPLLINNSKFDLRIYVLVTSVNPLRIYMYNNGLARFASVQYSDKLESLNDRCMHLTNYSINKLSENYAKNEDINACQGHKWTLKSLWTYFDERGINTKRLWATLRNLVIKTFLSGEPALNTMFKKNVISRYSCYELFGFDVLLDEDLTPWLLEVNISPSLHSELPLDMHVKGPLVQAVLNTAMYQVPPKLKEMQQQTVLEKYGIDVPQLCYDKRLYISYLSKEEIRKHNQFTSKLIECRDDYVDSILEDMQPDDIRCLITAEDELARSAPLERIFPGPNSYKYLEFIESPRYYNRLLDAWENRYGRDRSNGIEYLKKLCATKIHLHVPPAPRNKESCERDECPDDTESLKEDDYQLNSNGDLTKMGNPSDKTNAEKDILTQQKQQQQQQTQSCSQESNDLKTQINGEVFNGPSKIAIETK